MARSDIKTWLSLDEWAQLVGINPLHFNGLDSPLFNNNVCGDIWFQYAWQHSDRVGRDDIAMAVQQAEKNIALEVGYNLMPDWTIEERLPYPRPGFPEAYNLAGVNPRWMMKSIETPRGYVISGGVRAKSLIEAGASIVRTDEDVDAYAETCTVTVATTVTDENEIHLYYPAKSGQDGWEIRPIQVSLSGGNAIITFKIWQVVAANQMDRLDVQALDADDSNSYETTVDVYRVYNDPSTQVRFLWENDPTCCGTCTACTLGSQNGCFHLRDARMGFIVPSPGTWNAGDETFTAGVWSACREPDQVQLWYYSGYRDTNTLRPYAEMSPYWKYVVAFYAASLLERPVCGCSNVNQFIENWRKDAAYGSVQDGGFNVPVEFAANRLGTTMGALNAYRRIQQNGVKVNK